MSAAARQAKEREEDRDTAQLVARIQTGDLGAFAELYSRYFDRVYGYLRILLRDSHEAEDLTQQVFTELIDTIQKYEPREQPFRAWLFVVVRNRARMHLRRQRRVEVTDPHEIERERASAEPVPELPVLNWISDTDLLLFIERLPLPQRQVLVMRHLLDLTMTEVAEIMDSTPEAVRASHYRAMKTLERRLAAVGRTSRSRGRAPMLAGIKQAPVLRHRRFALTA
jgi:RNA polymerase sigma-70 factor (ECF subfamily)